MWPFLPSANVVLIKAYDYGQDFPFYLKTKHCDFSAGENSYY